MQCGIEVSTAELASKRGTVRDQRETSPSEVVPVVTSDMVS